MNRALAIPTGADQHDVERLRRFMAKVTFEPNSGCWLWTGALNGCGYGIFGTGRQRRPGAKAIVTVTAHRWAYEYYVGPVAAELTIDHRCRNTCCVNPSHMEVVTRTENIRRSDGITAQNARKTHCRQGHEFTEENTLRSSGGGRRCRTCQRATNARWEQREREKPQLIRLLGAALALAAEHRAGVGR